MTRIVYDLSRQELTTLELLSRDVIRFGWDATDAGFSFYQKDEFFQSLREHLTSRTQCLAYTYRAGGINSLTVFISGWEPEWEYLGRKNDGLIFFLSDQDEADKSLRLRWVSLPEWYHKDYLDEIYHSLC